MCLRSVQRWALENWVLVTTGLNGAKLGRGTLLKHPNHPNSLDFFNVAKVASSWSLFLATSSVTSSGRGWAARTQGMATWVSQSSGGFRMFSLSVVLRGLAGCWG